MAVSNWRIISLLIAAFALGCDGAQGSSSSNAGGAAGGGTTMGGNGGDGSTSASSTSTAVSTTSAGGGGTGGGVMGACPEGSLYALSDTALDESTVSMCDFKGDVLLIVNVAEA